MSEFKRPSTQLVKAIEDADLRKATEGMRRIADKDEPPKSHWKKATEALEVLRRKRKDK